LFALSQNPVEPALREDSDLSGLQMIGHQLLGERIEHGGNQLTANHEDHLCHVRVPVRLDDEAFAHMGIEEPVTYRRKLLSKKLRNIIVRIPLIIKHLVRIGGKLQVRCLQYWI
jgi:hypothetical protein